MRTRAALAAACALAAPVVAQEQVRGWRTVATPEDRARLRSWREAWMRALPAARAGGGGAAIAADPVLFDPDRTLRDPLPPAGAYRCRGFKLGSIAADRVAFAHFGPSRCRVEEDGAFRTLEGGQRAAGRLYPDTTGRAVFLGVLVLGDERRPLRYGRDRRRDMAGAVERIEEARWRIALPYPRFESLLDVIELVPDSVGATGGGTTASTGATGGAGSGGSAAR